MTRFRIGSIGYGNMVKALFQGALKKGVLNPSMTKVWSPRLASGEKTAAPFIIAQNNCDVVSDAEIVFISTKPNKVKEVCEEIRSVAHHKIHFVTMAAGIKMHQIEQYLNLKDAAITSIMPNTAASVGFGVTGFCKTPAVTDEQTHALMSILEATSLVKHFPEEKIDAVTAFTGCGTGYLLYVIEHYVKGAVAIGIDESTAQEMAIASMRGVAELMSVSQNSFEQERLRVTSKGGATEQAIHHFENQGFGTILQEAMRIAHEKAKSLGKPQEASMQFRLFPKEFKIIKSEIPECSPTKVM